jgi:hypothetical protein
VPVVFRYKGIRFMFYANEGNPREPIHIHAVRAGAGAKFWLDPVCVAGNRGFNATELRELVSVVETNAEAIRTAWKEFFNE